MDKRDEEQRRILDAVNETMIKGIIGTDNLISQLEILRILSLDGYNFHQLFLWLLRNNQSMMERVCTQYGIDRIADLCVHPGQMMPDRATTVAGVKATLQTELDKWEQLKGSFKGQK